MTNTEPEVRYGEFPLRRVLFTVTGDLVGGGGGGTSLFDVDLLTLDDAARLDVGDSRAATGGSAGDRRL